MSENKLKHSAFDFSGTAKADFNSVGQVGTRDMIIDQVTPAGPTDGEQLLPEAPEGVQSKPNPVYGEKPKPGKGIAF